jgi:hypothetical protein
MCCQAPVGEVTELVLQNNATLSGDLQSLAVMTKLQKLDLR